jgi:hypothetical protein
MSTDPNDFPSSSEMARLMAEAAERVQSVSSDPGWERLRAAVEAYEAVGPRGEMYRSEDDGSYFWMPDPDFARRSRPALDELLAARRELRQRHDAQAIDAAMSEVQNSTRLLTGYEPGTDVDGYSHYEPYGDPDAPLRRALRSQETALQYGDVLPQELRTRISALNAQIQEEVRGDNFSTIARLGEQVGYLERLLPDDAPTAEPPAAPELSLATIPIPIVQSPTQADPGMTGAERQSPRQRWLRGPQDWDLSAATADRGRRTLHGAPAGLRSAPLASSDQAASPDQAALDRLDGEARGPRLPSPGAGAAPGHQTGESAFRRALRAAAQVLKPPGQPGAAAGPRERTSTAPLPRPAASSQTGPHLRTDPHRRR